MLTAAELAHHHSLTCFFNSFFLEWNEVQRSDSEFILDLENGEQLLIPILFHSKLGRHHYGRLFSLKTGNTISEIGFSEIIHKLAQYLSVKFQTAPEQKKQFIERVLNSDENIKLSLEQRTQDIKDLYEGKLDFKSTEQGLFIGHTFHPTPKSRSEFTFEDYKRYSPEMGGSFPLFWILVSKDIYFQKTSQDFTETFWIEETYLNDFNDQHMARTKLQEGYIPYPLHPWQKQFIFNDPQIQNDITEKKIIILGDSDKQWFPTSSLRTLFNPESDFMLKFSMNVRLTNSIRHLLVHELDRGLQVHDLFTHPLGQTFLKDHPEFEVMYEPAFAGILGLDGSPLQETLVVGRFNPFKEKSETVVLATMTQDHPELKSNLTDFYIKQLAVSQKMDLRQASSAWFKEFLRVCLKPLLTAQADYGILLGSHQQNMVIEMKNSLPVKSYFRDCNGTGQSTLGFKLFADTVRSLTPENGNVLDNEVASFLFGYYVIINSTFNTISAIAHNGSVTEDELLTHLKAFLIELKSKDPKDPSFLDYLLTSPVLMHKGNFLCCFKNINENTEKNPLSIYTKISNPLYERYL